MSYSLSLRGAPFPRYRCLLGEGRRGQSHKSESTCRHRHNTKTCTHSASISVHLRTKSAMLDESQERSTMPCLGRGSWQWSHFYLCGCTDLISDAARFPHLEVWSSDLDHHSHYHYLRPGNLSCALHDDSRSWEAPLRRAIDLCKTACICLRYLAHRLTR